MCGSNLKKLHLKIVNSIASQVHVRVVLIWMILHHQVVVNLNVNQNKMIREKQQENGPVVIDLTGPDGNAFALMGYAKRFAKQLGWDKDQYHELINDMMSGDYEHLLEVFDKAFGTFVILER
jgi:hypothetical protein